MTDLKLKISCVTNDRFLEWLNEQLEQHGDWSDSELARRGKFSPSSISMLRSGERTPTWDVCVGIARGLSIHPCDVFIAAGLIPPYLKRSDLEPNEIEMLELYRAIKTKSYKKAVRTTARTFLEIEQEEQE